MIINSKGLCPLEGIKLCVLFTSLQVKVDVGNKSPVAAFYGNLWALITQIKVNHNYLPDKITTDF